MEELNEETIKAIEDQSWKQERRWGTLEELMIELNKKDDKDV